MHRNMTTSNEDNHDENYFNVSYIYNTLLVEERTETLIYDFVGNKNLHSCKRLLNNLRL
jgi:hypothetical protein